MYAAPYEDFAGSHLAAIAMAVRLTIQGLAESFDVEICETAKRVRAEAADLGASSKGARHLSMDRFLGGLGSVPPEAGARHRRHAGRGRPLKSYGCWVKIVLKMLYRRFDSNDKSYIVLFRSFKSMLN